MRSPETYTYEELLAISVEELIYFEWRVSEAEEELWRRAKIKTLLARAQAVANPMSIQGLRPQEVVASDARPVQSEGWPLEPGNQSQAKSVKPPRFDIEKKYVPKGLKAKQVFESKLRYHFKQNAWYYEAGNSDQCKILTAVNAFGEVMLDRWAQFENGGADVDTMTWSEFDEFLLRQIKAPEPLRDDANRKYQTLLQRTNQRVTEFSRVLRSCKQQLDVTYNDAQLKSHLKGRILESVRIKAQESGKAEPEGYEAYVTHLQSIEDKMPERQKELRSLHQSSNEKSEKSSNWSSGSGNRGSSTSRGRRGASRGRGCHRYKPYNHDSKRSNDEKSSYQDKALRTCNHCGKTGHEEPACWIKHPRKMAQKK